MAESTAAPAFTSGEMWDAIKAVYPEAEKRFTGSKPYRYFIKSGIELLSSNHLSQHAAIADAFSRISALAKASPHTEAAE